MKWTTAVALARSCEVTYKEWCKLYYNPSGPTDYQIRLCEAMAHLVLERNGYIDKDTIFQDRPKAGVEISRPPRLINKTVVN